MVLDFIDTLKPSDVILVGRWEQVVNDESYQAELAQRISEISSFGSRIWLVRQVPNPGFVVPENLARDYEFGWRNAHLVTDRYLATTRTLEDVVIERTIPSLMGILDPMPHLCDEHECRLMVNGKPAYTDDNHLSESAAISLMEMLIPVTATIERSHKLASKIVP